MSKINELEARIKKLEDIVFSNPKKKLKIETKINFDLNSRAYVSRYASDKSGPKKFVLILAFLLKGDMDSSVSISEIKDLWLKMSTKKLLGKYNDFYPNEAKTKGWVDTKEHGFYKLTKEWEEVL